MSWARTIGLSPYGSTLRQMRRLMHLQEEETVKFLRRLLRKPELFREHIRRYVFVDMTTLFL